MVSRPRPSTEQFEQHAFHELQGGSICTIPGYAVPELIVLAATSADCMAARVRTAVGENRAADVQEHPPGH